MGGGGKKKSPHFDLNFKNSLPAVQKMDKIESFENFRRARNSNLPTLEKSKTVHGRKISEHAIDVEFFDI